MSRSGCDEVRGLLPWFAGGDLDTAAAGAVREHLLACLSCRNEAAALQRAVSGLRQGADQGAPALGADFFATLQRDICARVESVGSPGAVTAASWARWRGVAIAAAAGLLVAIGFAAANWSPESSVWTRPPVATSAVFAEPKAVPWAGPRAPMRLLGDEFATGGAAVEDVTLQTQGLRARDALRRLVDESLPLPPVSQPPR